MTAQRLSKRGDRVAGRERSGELAAAGIVFAVGGEVREISPRALTRVSRERRVARIGRELGVADRIALRELVDPIPRRWRANFYRVDRGAPSGAGDEFSAWSPILKQPADFHETERFGVLRFGDE